MTDQDQGPGLHIDSDWKAQAQAEKDRLNEKAQQKDDAEHGQGERLPEASFKTLVGMLASQAIMGLGAMGDQQSGRVIIDLEGAKFSIDLLGVLEEKSRGNLSDEESKELSQVLSELRARFVQIQNLVAQQAASQAGASTVPGSTVTDVAGSIRPE